MSEPSMIDMMSESEVRSACKELSIDCERKRKRIAELEARDVVTTEYLQSWIDRAYDAEAQLDAVRSLQEYGWTEYDNLVPMCDGGWVSKEQLEAALNGENK